MVYITGAAGVAGATTAGAGSTLIVFTCKL